MLSRGLGKAYYDNLIDLLPGERALDNALAQFIRRHARQGRSEALRYTIDVMLPPRQITYIKDVLHPRSGSYAAGGDYRPATVVI